MRRELRELYVYARLVLVIALTICLLILIVQNNSRISHVWIWREFEIPTLWLMAVTGIVSVGLFWVLMRLRRLIRELRDVRTERHRETLHAEQQAMAQKLSEQERRIDEKLRQSLKED
ncbi:MAG: hypothetical protein V3T70_03460 [Phycisphaerae bacterium]